MQYAAVYKPDSEPLDQFIQRNGGINACATRFARCLGQGAVTRVPETFGKRMMSPSVSTRLTVHIRRYNNQMIWINAHHEDEMLSATWAKYRVRRKV
jgi:hypothetical protein